MVAVKGTLDAAGYLCVSDIVTAGVPRPSPRPALTEGKCQGFTCRMHLSRCSLRPLPHASRRCGPSYTDYCPFSKVCGCSPATHQAHYRHVTFVSGKDQEGEVNVARAQCTRMCVPPLCVRCCFADSGPSYCLLVSGLGFGGPCWNPLAVSLLTEYVAGSLGDLAVSACRECCFQAWLCRPQCCVLRLSCLFSRYPLVPKGRHSSLPHRACRRVWRTAGLAR